MLYDKIAPYLWDGKSPIETKSAHICLSISMAHNELPVEARIWLREKIREGLRGKPSVRDWARERGYLNGMMPEQVK